MSQRPLDVIHSDVWGPTENVSLAGNKYYVTFVDDHTRKVWVYFMKSKRRSVWALQKLQVNGRERNTFAY